ncbi:MULTISPECIES: D-2-hydroxyacid dehydrogenase family protein [unclassified Janthinobacterium]|uniref:D-2-hydroxyacid dehydrogenase family protein n=1 Tax=unclassified Janthinobacterium TaxID=2610881 RepID=UPI00160D701E|nr:MULTISPECIES: D-2-hydroxyacid dehydrogenase family protein [unclassified Janthinobacterium]MBB5371522.1 D-3-phosphoglycerate dehydrogenase [Janthinobacterium sp. K2C7]MBB5384410.1 D-3-phosphoglycerate dehydrogenase [Janthinobacterium sp. K2Li3]MBB5389686.1 D-3-phosphoglycerate dehydrogenase [Janthinobacterium sp. K2E3]
MKIAILDDYQDAVRTLDCFKLVDGHEVKVFNNTARGLGQLAIRLAQFDALVLIRERSSFNRALLSKLPNLKLLSQTGKVAGHIDVAAATELGIAIAEGVGSPTAPAELTWALIMAAQRKILPYAEHLKEGLWQTSSIEPALNTLGTVLKGRTLAIWGYGKIGQLIAGYGRAFGMNILVWGSEASRAAAVAAGDTAAQSREAFFAQADVLSLHLRLSDKTRGLVTKEDLARMKPTALFVNTSRAELVETGALEAALPTGRPGAAALDVFTNEPLPPTSPLLKLPNVLATPHLGYVERDSYELYFRYALQNIVDFEQGQCTRLLNPEVLQHARQQPQER